MRDICKVNGLLRRNMELGLRIRCRGLILHMWVITAGRGGGGGILFLFLLLDAVSLYLRDIFSVVKLTYSFWFATGGVGCYIVVPHTFTLVAKYIIVWHNFCSGISSHCVSGGRKRAFFLLLLILIFFSGCTCIIIPLGEQRHLVLHFPTIIWLLCWKFRALSICLILWCYVTVWPIVGQYVPFIGNYIFLVIRCLFLYNRDILSVAEVDSER